LHSFSTFPGETSREVEKRFEPVNVGTSEGRFNIEKDTIFSLAEEY